MLHEEIAIALGISPPTLRKHFELELSTGALQRRMGVIQAMYDLAIKGNVAAQRAYMATTPMPAAPPTADPDPVKPAEPLGKKAQANVDAVTAQVGTDWESLLRPTGPVQ